MPVAVSLIWEVSPLAAPGLAVSAVSGTVAHGAIVTVSGALFGSKPVAAPVKYDDFQNLSVGQDLNANGWVTAGYYPPVASNANLRSGTPFTRNAHSRFESGPFQYAHDVSNFRLVGLNASRYYVDAWHYFHVDADPQPQNIKPIRFHQNDAGAPNAYLNFYTPDTSDSLACGRDGVSLADGAWFGNSPTGSLPSGAWYDHWIHVQYLIDAGSGNNAFDGSCVVYINGALRYDHRNIATIGSGFYTWPEVYLGNYVRTDPHGGAHAYWESVYVDRSWARVEIGDAPVYNACTHREVQVPVAWSDTSISVQLNRGSFPSFSALYLFVVDAQNNTSPGFRLGPTSPANLRIIR